MPVASSARPVRIPDRRKRRRHVRAGYTTPQATRISFAERLGASAWSLGDALIVLGLIAASYYLLWNYPVLSAYASRLLAHPISPRRDAGFREVVFSAWLLLTLACVVRFSLGKYRITWWQFGFRGLPRNWQYLVVAGFLGWFATTTLYIDIVSQLQLGPLVPHSNVHRALFSDLPLAAAYSFLVGTVFAPFVEEVVFRGFVFRAILGRRLFLKLPWAGFWTAALISGALFAGYHLQVGLLIPFTIVGVINAWVYAASGSLWTAVLCHATVNAYGLTRALGYY